MVNPNRNYNTCLHFNIFHPNASPKGAKTEDGNSAAWHPKERHTHIARGAAQCTMSPGSDSTAKNFRMSKHVQTPGHAKFTKNNDS